MLREFDAATLGRYQSIKKVSAGKIVEITRFDDPPQGIRGLIVEAADGERMGFDPAQHPGIFARYTPVVGDRLVAYDAEGDAPRHVSISPAAAFETGYLPDAAPVAGTPKSDAPAPAADDVGSGP